MERDLWNPDPEALALLDTLGSPFSTSGFRRAVVATASDWKDVSFGARAADGTCAAVAVLARRRSAESVPPSGYGGVVATRALSDAETVSFLELASRELRVARLSIRWLQLTDESSVGKPIGKASVVPLERDTLPNERYSRLARRSLKRSSDSGATVAVSRSADAFWPIYANAAEGWAMRYPEALIRALLADGVAQVHAVSVEGRIVSVLYTLVTGSHWMCWLAAQTDEGRAIAASYRAYDALLADAHAAGVASVNLGVSVRGGSEFKHHLGAREAEMREWSRERVTRSAVRVMRQVVDRAVSRAKGAHGRTS